MYHPQSEIHMQNVPPPHVVDSFDPNIDTQPQAPPVHMQDVPPPHVVDTFNPNVDTPQAPPVHMQDVPPPHLVDTIAKVCRCCHMTEVAEGDEFIAPCKCSGTIRYVHRSCLDKWRSVSPQPESFYRCDICHTPYVFKEKTEEVKQRSCCDPRLKVAFLITLDLTIMLVVWQALVFICTGLVYLCDWYRYRDRFAPEWATKFGIDYVCGLALFFFLMGIAAILIGIFKLLIMCIRSMCGCEKVMSNYTYDTYPYYRSPTWEYFWLWYWPIWYDPYPHRFSCCDCCDGGGDCSGSDCNCSGGDCSGSDCKCDGGDEGAAILLIIVLIIVIIIIIIGILFALYLAINLIFRIVSNRVSVLYRKERITEYIVADLDSA